MSISGLTMDDDVGTWKLRMTVSMLAHVSVMRDAAAPRRASSAAPTEPRHSLCLRRIAIR